MKDKKAEQVADKQRHKEQLKAKRRSGVSFERQEPVMIEKPTILIVCEGKNTEPSYFNQFRLSSAKVKPVGEGFNTISLVNRAIQIAALGNYEQVWCVFDKDDFNNVDFNNAIILAENNNFHVAYSNQAFEYWLILHFADHQGGGMHRNDYNDKINQLIAPYNLVYDGQRSKLVNEAFFELLDGVDERTGKERKILAIERAERNYNHFDHINPSAEESTTTVFKLITELLKYL